MPFGTKQKIFFTTTFMLCDNNGYMSTRINTFFKNNGYELVTAAEQADWIVISTCGFDQGREDEATAITTHYMERFSGAQRIIICGCLPKINPELFREASVTTIGPKELYKFNDLFLPRIPIDDVTGGNLDERFISKDYGLLDCYYLQICQGCVNTCSYCGIKKAKGYVTSVPPEKLLREVEEAVQSGFGRIMLVADDCGSYGVDLGVHFGDLLRQISHFGLPLSINYIHPAEFQQLYLECGSSIFEHIEFINIPLQSTSKRILELMNRPYDPAEVMRTVKEIRAEFPRTFFETHMIYGFPTETREEFQDTFGAVEAFDSVIYFYYTDRKNVQASLLQPRISDSEMIYRTKQIINHSRFTVTREGAAPPLVLLGYDLEKAGDIFGSLARSRLENKSEFVMLGNVV